MEQLGLQLYHQLIDAWNGRNAEKFAALFSSEAICVGFDGSEMFGNAQIKSQLSAIFEGHPTAEYVTLVQESGPLTKDALLVRAHVGMVPPGKDKIDPAKNAIQIMIVDLTNGKNEIVVFQNTPAQFHGREEDSKWFTQQLEEQYESTHHV